MRPSKNILTKGREGEARKRENKRAGMEKGENQFIFPGGKIEGGKSNPQCNHGFYFKRVQQFFLSK